jgi:hypothetical protein
MARSAPVLRKLLPALALLSFLACFLLFVAGMFFPRTLAFLDPVVCPRDMSLDNEVTSQSDVRGNVTGVNLVCVGDQGQVDVSGKMLLILFSLPILGMVLLVAWVLVDSGKELKKT